MGHKVNPIGIRLGIAKDWNSKWLAGKKHFAEYLAADLKVSRGIVREAYRALSSAGILEISNGRAPRVGVLRNVSLAPVIQHALATRQATL